MSLPRMFQRQRLQQQQTYKQQRRAWNKISSVYEGHENNNMIVCTGGPQIDR